MEPLLNEFVFFSLPWPLRELHSECWWRCRVRRMQFKIWTQGWQEDMSGLVSLLTCPTMSRQHGLQYLA